MSFFGELNRTRDYIVLPTKTLPRALSHRDIAAWAQIAGVHLEPWELAAIELMDDLYLKKESGDDPARPPMAPATDDNLKMLFRSLIAKQKLKS